MGEYLFPFEKLDVWEMAVDLAEYVLGLLEKLPQNKHIRLISQMEAAVTSPAQNTAGSAPASSPQDLQAGGQGKEANVLGVCNKKLIERTNLYRTY